MPTGQPFRPSPETREHVVRMAQLGIPQDSIAIIVGVSPKTLRAHLREELDIGKAECHKAFAQRLFALAMQDDDLSVASRCTIFGCKTQLKWSEKTTVEVQHTEGEATALDTLSEEGRLELRELLKRETQRKRARANGSNGNGADHTPVH